MARRGEDIWPDVEYHEDEWGKLPVDWEAETKWLDDLLDNQPDGLLGYVLRFPVADGYAFYKVVDLGPLTISWIPYGDQYHIPDAHIRGLNHEDVERMVQADRKVRGLFGRPR